jgi:hypothetical protein
MINYTLKCDAGHSFDSWFQSATAFETLAKARQLSCVQCGSTNVSKAIMAPRIAKGTQGGGADQSAQDAPTAPVLREPTSEVQQALADLRRKVEKSADYVGDRFTSEARAMHLGEKPERSIYGEARLDQARALIEDGIPLMPLPFRPKQKLS